MSGACYKIFCTVSAGVCVWSFFALFPAASILHHPSIIPQSLFHPQDALPSMADLYPPSKPIFSFYPRGTDRTRTFPRGREVDYFNKQYSDGFLPPPLSTAPFLSCVHPRQTQRIRGLLVDRNVRIPSILLSIIYEFSHLTCTVKTYTLLSSFLSPPLSPSPCTIFFLIRQVRGGRGGTEH